MAVLTSSDLRAFLPGVITPFVPARVKSSSYELCLGDQVYVTAGQGAKKQVLASHEQCVISPGEFALLLTAETLQMPNDKLALISIKAGIKFRGLINVSGFHVDPGFRGHLKFSVYNAGSNPVTLDAQQPCFQIWFLELTSALPNSDLYQGTHQDQRAITSTDVDRLRGFPVSPQALNRQLTNLTDRVDTWVHNAKVFFALGGVLLVSVIVALFVEHLDLRERQADVQAQEAARAFLLGPIGQHLIRQQLIEIEEYNAPTAPTLTMPSEDTVNTQ